MSVPLTAALRQQYQNLFNTCVVNPGQIPAVNGIIARIVPNQGRYQSVAGPLGIPWYVVAVIHNMESSLNFNCHLHNGDPLTARTVQVPAGRPPNGQPPFTWEQSATDALTLEALPTSPTGVFPRSYIGSKNTTASAIATGLHPSIRLICGVFPTNTPAGSSQRTTGSIPMLLLP